MSSNRNKIGHGIGIFQHIAFAFKLRIHIHYIDLQK